MIQRCLPNGLQLATAVLLSGALALAAPADARMYQWVDPDTGITQLSGRPPPWYRSDSGGPRVFVFADGQLVDDTAYALDAGQRAARRQEAFRIADQAHRERAQRAATRRPALEPEQVPTEAQLQALVPEQETDLEAVLQAGAAETPAADAARAARTQARTEETVSRLKAIIDAWDRRQTERARQVIESAPDDD